MRGTLYLASTSPRRQDLLRAAGLAYVLHPPGPEPAGEGTPRQLAMLRARSEHTGVIDLARRMLEHDPDHKVALEAMMDAYSGLGEDLRGRVKGSAAEVK